jgi:hypothetical protein
VVERAAVDGIEGHVAGLAGRGTRSDAHGAPDRGCPGAGAAEGPGAAAPPALPKAFGALTWVSLGLEICDWHRFTNRRQVSSYTGLCPGVRQSGGRRRDGAINRHGHPRVRALLIELVWRLARWQPDYPPVRALVAGIARGAQRRKLAVAAARRLAVDLWRLATGRTTPPKLNLIVPLEVNA